MGLSVGTENQHMNFNWTGVTFFTEWSERVLDETPFVGWVGGNGTIAVFDREPEEELREVKGDKKEAEKWIKAFEKYVKDNEDEAVLEAPESWLISTVANRGRSEGRVSANKEEESMWDKKISEWGYLQAIGWYRLLKDGIENGYITYM